VRSATPVAGSRATEAQLWRPTPLWALELSRIPSRLHFVRDHFPVPELDPAAWAMSVHGSGGHLAVDLARLRALPSRTLSVVLECAGHRRTEYDPVPPGLPWACGAVAEARWTGASLRDVLAPAGIPAGTAEVVLEGADAGPVDGFEGVHHFARSLPLDKSFDRDVLLAYEMNGEPIPVGRGGPVRAVVPGWYATDSVKWLAHIWFSAQPFDGVFQAHDYRLLVPGEPGLGRRMTTLPANSLITTPPDGEACVAAGSQAIHGVAWGGTGGIAEVLVRLDDRPWRRARLGRVRGRYQRVFWEAHWTLAPGEHELTARAVDRAGNAQPETPEPNLRGYANNAVHRVSFRVA
jgi:DMSO/TMAO reductase YedYZ molybdopterin-dependent catalytic subunit